MYVTHVSARFYVLSDLFYYAEAWRFCKNILQKERLHLPRCCFL